MTKVIYTGDADKEKRLKEIEIAIGINNQYLHGGIVILSRSERSRRNKINERLSKERDQILKGK